MDSKNLILKLLDNSSPNIFLTGKAGTGKTSLLHQIKTEANRNLVVAAFTSVAAINAGGVTLNSFFQIPFGPIIPQLIDDFSSETILHKFSPEKLRLIRALELIIIDEISMVRADMLDFLDLTLRRVNFSNEPFGGIQLLLIGDPLQLPPVKENWEILNRYYQSPYFFESIALKKIGFLTIELQKVYRQSDSGFVNLLNGVRTGNFTDEMLSLLNTRYVEVVPSTDERFISITTHHKIVNAINQKNLEALPGEVFTYNATITGDFPKADPPVDEILLLKIGARIIMAKNDDSGKKAFYNGRAGRISGLNANGVVVTFLDDNSELALAPQTWHNVKYNIDTNSDKVSEKNVGSFTQYPVKLAWAITVHKSQGLTFDNVILDVASSFDPGQTYVALSRCRSLEGIVLRNPVIPSNIKTDPDAIHFMAHIPPLNKLETVLSQLTIAEQHRALRSFFDFSSIEKRLFTIQTLNAKFQLQTNKLQGSESLQKQLIRPSNKFIKDEIEKLLPHISVEENNQFQERLVSATNYFGKQLPEHIESLTAMVNHLSEIIGDAARITDLLGEILHLLKVKSLVFEGLISGHDFWKIKQASIAALSSIAMKTNGKDYNVPIINPQLYEQLVLWRQKYSTKQSLPLHIVMTEKTMRTISEKTPRTLDQFSVIAGIGPAKAKEIGRAIIEIVNNFFGTQQLF